MSSRRTLRVLILGPIGAGKSLVSRIFQILGAPVFNSDQIATDLMQNHVGIQQQLKQVFGDRLYFSEQNQSNLILNRDYLRICLFNDLSAREKLASILYPHTLNKSREWFASLSSPYALKEFALLISSKDNDIDKIIIIEAERQLSAERVVLRNPSWSKELALKVFDMQMHSFGNIKADFRIVNNLQSELLPQIWQIHANLLKI